MHENELPGAKTIKSFVIWCRYIDGYHTIPMKSVYHFGSGQRFQSFLSENAKLITQKF